MFSVVTTKVMQNMPPFQFPTHKKAK